MSELPQRACRLVLDLQADTRDALMNALENIICHIDRGELTKGCSGGWDAGYTYEYKEGTTPTGDEYRAALRAWRASDRVPAVHDSGLSTNREQGSEVNKSSGQ